MFGRGINMIGIIKIIWFCWLDLGCFRIWLKGLVRGSVFWVLGIVWWLVVILRLWKLIVEVFALIKTVCFWKYLKMYWRQLSFINWRLKELIFAIKLKYLEPGWIILNPSSNWIITFITHSKLKNCSSETKSKYKV